MRSRPKPMRPQETLNWIDLTFGAEGATRIGDGARKYEKGVPNLLLARLIPSWHLEMSSAAGLRHLDRVLQSVGLLHVLGIVGVDEGADTDHRVARTDLLFVNRVLAGLVDRGRVVILRVVCNDMKRLPASGSVIVTGPASRSKTADE